MKVRELIIELIEYDMESEIILQKDNEGNGYEVCRGSDNNVIYDYREEFGEGYVYDLSWSAGDCCLDEDHWDHIKKSVKPSVILFP